MSLGKTKSRRDSFGLEVRPDGTLTFDFPKDELASVGLASRTVSGGGLTNGGGIDRQRRSSRPQLYKSDFRATIGPLLRRRKRRDSFGLEVREDGTLSFDQLSSGGPLDSPRVVSRSETDGNVENGTRRDSEIRDSWDGRGSHHTEQSGRLRRRDSFGLSVRADGTLSLDGLVNSTQGVGNGTPDHQSSYQDQPSTLRSTSYGNNNRSGRIASSERNRPSGVIAGSPLPPTRGGGGRTRDAMGPTLGHREVQLLMERVHRLEAELERRGRPPTRDAMDAPPAYEPRSSSRGRNQRSGDGLSPGDN